jgi:signal transduction histidine kinase
LYSYAYTAYLWPGIVLAVFVAFLGWYGWRHRTIPGALPFAAACLFGFLWSMGSLLETAAVTPDAKIFWYRFLTIWQMPMVTAATCFVAQFAGLGRWLTKRVLILLAVPPVLFAILVLTDGLHHLAWTSLSVFDSTVEFVRGPVIVGGLLYSYLLFLFNIGVLVWFGVRAARYRWPVVFMLLGQVGARAIFELGTRLGFPENWALDPFVLAAVFGLYAVALFRFHALDPVPAARAAALAQMREGLLVLDMERRIVDANMAAERILSEPVASLRGRRAEDLLPAPLGVLPHGWLSKSKPAAVAEFRLEVDKVTKDYVMEATGLTDERGGELGQIVLLHDVTEQKRAQARLIEQERVLATLQERERLARELHDSAGQVLGYVSMQAQTIRKRLQDGDAQKADVLLARMTEVAQNAHADVRESIVALRTGPSEEWSFLPALGRYLENFASNYGIQTSLSTGEGVDEQTFEESTAVQLFRVVQEALSNTRKHARAKNASVTIDKHGDNARVVIADDGTGFGPLEPGDGNGHFGLVFVRERMAQVGGQIEIESQMGAGTRVCLTVPQRDKGEANQ